MGHGRVGRAVGRLPPAARARRPHPGQVAEWIVGTLGCEFPDVAARIQHGAPLDATAALVSRVRPPVRKPVQRLSGGAVRGMADAVVSTDPIGGQGWNLSSLCAQLYLPRIVEHGDQTFTPDWQQETFADPRSYGTWLYDPESASAFLNEAAPA